MASEANSGSLDQSMSSHVVQHWRSEVEETKGQQAPELDSTAATHAMGNPGNAETLLRRLSLVQSPRSQGSVPHTGPDILHPGSKVSGRVISAVFCVPYTIRHRKNADWVSPS